MPSFRALQSGKILPITNLTKTGTVRPKVRHTLLIVSIISRREEIPSRVSQTLEKSHKEHCLVPALHVVKTDGLRF